MAKDKLDEYLQQGMYGAKEVKPDERRRFLGTLRERVVVALTKPEVRRKQIAGEFKRLLEEHKEARLYLNGHMEYRAISKYIQLADQMSIEYKVVTNKDYDSRYGLVLAYDYAIDKEEITLSGGKKVFHVQAPPANKGLFSFIKKIFKRR